MNTEINPDDLPKALAEAMNCRIVVGWLVAGKDPDDGSTWPGVICEKFAPHLSHDHAQICIAECFLRNLGRAFICALWLAIQGPGSPFLCTYDAYEVMILATPEQKARAALAVLTSNPTK